MISKVVRGELNRIDGLLCKGDQDAYDLWLILTALRGPDNENLDKVQTTAVVRAAAFPLTAGPSGVSAPFSCGGRVSSAPLFNTQTFVVEPPYSRHEYHFCSHLKEAAKRLDLEVKQQI